MRRKEPEPETILGVCWGAACKMLTDWERVPLFKHPHHWRYRCADCFEKEVGYRHHLSPAKRTKE